MGNLARVSLYFLVSKGAQGGEGVKEVEEGGCADCL